MSLIKYIDRLERIHDLISRCATGNSHEFASKVGVSRAVLMQHLKEIKSLGAEVKYNKLRGSYYYLTEFKVEIGQKNNSYRRVSP